MKDREKYNAYHKEYQLKRYHRRRATAMIFLGGKCVVCGSKDFLELDHKDPAEKSFNLAKLWSCSERKYLDELGKCQLLCKKHHKAKTSEEDKARRPLTHGKEWAARKHKCRCTLCLEWIKHNSKRASNSIGRKPDF